MTTSGFLSELCHTHAVDGQQASELEQHSALATCNKVISIDLASPLGSRQRRAALNGPWRAVLGPGHGPLLRSA